MVSINVVEVIMDVITLPTIPHCPHLRSIEGKMITLCSNEPILLDD